MFQCSVEGNLIHLFWKQSSSSFSDALTFVLIGYKKLINCSKLQHSEMIDNSYRLFSFRYNCCNQKYNIFLAQDVLFTMLIFNKVCLKMYRKIK